jgi:hypothetical protein
MRALQTFLFEIGVALPEAVALAGFVSAIGAWFVLIRDLIGG